MSDARQRAREIFAEHVAALGPTEEADLEGLCAKHPELGEELHQLHEDWKGLAGILDELSGGVSFAERLRQRYATPIDCAPALDPEPPPAQTPSERFTQRVANLRAPRSRYRFKGEVARGGMGAILAVWDEDLRRNLAMKVILGKGEDPTTLGRFLDEAQVTGQLDHPGIVPVHELGLDDEGRVYFTMRLVQGRELGEIFELAQQRAEGWTRLRALDVLLKVCEAMAYAHARGVIHRDLKPGNIMVGRYGEVYVMDWGLARVVDQPDRRDLRPREPGLAPVETERAAERDQDPDTPLMTVDGAVLGTPVYMSPEQARGDVEAMGPGSDVYSLGAALYQLLSGQMPFMPPGERISSHAVLQRLRAGPPRPLVELAPDGPPELVAICEKAMAREPSERYADMRAMAEDLRAYREDRVVRAYHTGPLAELGKWVKRNRGLAAASALALALLVAGLVVSLSFYGLARTRAAESSRNLRTVLDLSQSQALDELRQRADRELWPAHSEMIPAMRTWIAEAERMRDLLGHLRGELEGLRSEALPWTDEERERDGQTHPRTEELQEARSALEELRTQANQLRGAHRAKVAAFIAEEERLLARLADQVAARRTWRFAARGEQSAREREWLQAGLARLTADLQAFVEGPLRRKAAEGAYGSSLPEVQRRLAIAERIAARSAQARERWAAAIASIRDDPGPCSGLQIEPVVGLLPLGWNPRTLLWEFWHIQSGAEPRPDPDWEPGQSPSRWIIAEETAMVFVLIPGGTFQMGDPRDGPVRELSLDPFFLSKYEMTQAQWLRIVGSNPSSYDASLAEQISWNHPVEMVSWNECAELLDRLALELPTSAQWEYACRGGAQTPWWTGSDPASLDGAANLRDAAFLRAGGEEPGVPWDDGFPATSAVGSFSANRFGLHDVHGNVWEWCRDLWRPDPLEANPPTSSADGERLLVIRGGSFAGLSDMARSGFSLCFAPGYHSHTLGLRPAITLDG